MRSIPDAISFSPLYYPSNLLTTGDQSTTENEYMANISPIEKGDNPNSAYFSERIGDITANAIF